MFHSSGFPKLDVSPSHQISPQRRMFRQISPSIPSYQIETSVLSKLNDLSFLVWFDLCGSFLLVKKEEGRLTLLCAITRKMTKHVKSNVKLFERLGLINHQH